MTERERGRGWFSFPSNFAWSAHTFKPAYCVLVEEFCHWHRERTVCFAVHSWARFDICLHAARCEDLNGQYRIRRGKKESERQIEQQKPRNLSPDHLSGYSASIRLQNPNQHILCSKKILGKYENSVEAKAGPRCRQQLSGANSSSLAGSGEDVSPDAIAGRIDSLKMASSFDNNNSGSGGMESAGPSRSESPSNAPEAAKVSPPAGGTQSTLLHEVQQIHSTPTAGGIPLDLSDVMGSGPGLPFRTNNQRGAASSSSNTTGTRPPMLHELTPVIRNTSGSGEDLDLRASGSNIVSPEGAKNGGPMLELSIPPRTGAGITTGGGVGQLPPRVSALPMRTHQSSTTSTPRPSVSAIASTAAAADQSNKQQLQQKPPPIPQGQRTATRSYSAGNLDSESLVKTVREYYSTQQQQTSGSATPVEPKGLADEFDLAKKQEIADHATSTSEGPSSVDSQTASELALAQRQVQSEAYLRRRKESEAEHDKDKDAAAADPNSTENRAQLAIERALASVGSGPTAPIDEANVNQAIQNAVQDVTGGTVSGFDASGLFRIPQGPPPGPPIPLSSPERRVQSFDRRNVPSAGKHNLPGSPRPTTSAIAPSSSASPGRSGLPPLPGSTGPASQYLQPEQSVFAGAEKPQYQPTRDTSLTDIGKVGDPGIDSIFNKEGRPIKIHSPKRPAPGSRSQQMQGIFQAQSLGQGGHLPPQIQAPDSPSLRNPIPLEQRDWSIPSIRMAHHVNSGESYTTVETYDDDTLGEEDDIVGGGGDFDDATLSSRGSTPQEMKSSVDVLAEIDMSIG